MHVPQDLMWHFRLKFFETKEALTDNRSTYERGTKRSCGWLPLVAINKSRFDLITHSCGLGWCCGGGQGQGIGWIFSFANCVPNAYTSTLLVGTKPTCGPCVLASAARRSSGCFALSTMIFKGERRKGSLSSVIQEFSPTVQPSLDPLAARLQVVVAAWTFEFHIITRVLFRS